MKKLELYKVQYEKEFKDRPIGCEVLLCALTVKDAIKIVEDSIPKGWSCTIYSVNREGLVYVAN